MGGARRQHRATRPGLQDSASGLPPPRATAAAARPPPAPGAHGVPKPLAPPALPRSAGGGRTRGSASCPSARAQERVSRPVPSPRPTRPLTLPVDRPRLRTRDKAGNGPSTHALAASHRLPASLGGAEARSSLWFPASRPACERRGGARAPAKGPGRGRGQGRGGAKVERRASPASRLPGRRRTRGPAGGTHQGEAGGKPGGRPGRAPPTLGPRTASVPGLFYGSSRWARSGQPRRPGPGRRGHGGAASGGGGRRSRVDTAAVFWVGGGLGLAGGHRWDRAAGAQGTYSRAEASRRREGRAGECAELSRGGRDRLLADPKPGVPDSRGEMWRTPGEGDGRSQPPLPSSEGWS